jgi:hypothetical protein
MKNVLNFYACQSHGEWSFIGFLLSDFPIEDEEELPCFTEKSYLVLPRRVTLFCRKELPCFAAKSYLVLPRRVTLFCREELPCFAEKSYLVLPQRVTLLCREELT